MTSQEKENCVLKSETFSKKPCQFFVFSFLSLQCKFNVHSCILCCFLLDSLPIQLLIFLFPVICFKLPITQTFFDFPRRSELSGVDYSCLLADNLGCAMRDFQEQYQKVPSLSLFISKQCIIKQLLDSDFVISGIIKVSANVINPGLRLG